MKKIYLMTAMVMGATLALGTTLAQAAGKYPARDITTAVVWGAGGGTDVCNRTIMAEMSKVLGTNINVINKTGGVAGSIGMNYAKKQAADGYTLVGLSESNVTSAVQGGFTDKFTKVWHPFIVGGSPDVISVTPSTGIKNFKDLIAAAKAKPGTIKACASGAGSIHHLNLLAVEDGTGAKFHFVPYKGSAPCQNAALTGEMNVVVTSVAEQQQLIKGKKFIPVAMLVPDAFTIGGFGTIPSAFADFPKLSKFLPIMQAIGFAIRNDAPAEAKKVLGDAFAKAMASDALKKFAASKYYVLSGKHGKDAQKVFDSLESQFTWKLHELGAAKYSPAKFGIPKP
ncbi:MAG: tripartite tricarboxylate transporter substrate binding protein [Rhodospirillales bacterium]|nr:tripartite tricarboxylate transporter substrate binding protein [Rhodospirillales bacterium]